MPDFTDDSDLPPHAEDPVQENPFPIGDPRRRIWAEASLEAEIQLTEAKKKMLAIQPRDAAEYQRWGVTMIVVKFHVWAWRDLQIVRDHGDARLYRKALDASSQSWLQQVTENPPDQIDLNSFLPELRIQLLRRTEHWYGAALEIVRKLKSPAVTSASASATELQPKAANTVSANGAMDAQSLSANANRTTARTEATDQVETDADELAVLLEQILIKEPTTIEKWASGHRFGRTTVFDWRKGKLLGRTLKGRVSQEKAAAIELAILEDAKALGLDVGRTRTSSDSSG